MFRKNSIRILCIGLYLAVPVILRAQDVDPAEAERRAAQERARQEAAERAAAAEQQRILQESQKQLREFLNDTRDATNATIRRTEQRLDALRRQEAQDFNNALVSFESSKHELERALGFKASLKPSAKILEKTTGSLLGFVKGLHKNRARLNASEFDGYTPVELGWEALTTAERITPQLTRVYHTEESEEIDIHFLESLTKLEGDLLRLQWMTRHLK